MRAVLWDAPGTFSLHEVDPPSVGPGELLVEMRACGLCGSDLGKIYKPRSHAPLVLGHELVGIVRAVGPGVHRFAPGDRAVVAHHVPCGTCRACRHGNHSMCAQFKATNIDPCGLAELVRVPALNADHATFVVPPHLPDEAAVFMEPLACGLRAVKRSEVLSGDWIAVVGAGGMGLLIAQAVQAYGARAIAVDILDSRLDLARRLGIGATVSAASGDAAAAIRAAADREGVDGAILTAVTAGTVAMAMRALRPGGRMNIFADASGSTEIPIDFTDLFYRELSVFSSYSSTPAELGEALGLIAEGRVQVMPLVSHHMRLPDFAEGVRLQREGRATKVIFHP